MIALLMAFSTAFATWLGIDGLERRVVAKLTAHNGTSTTTLYAATSSWTTLGTDTPANQWMPGVLIEDSTRAWLSGNNPWTDTRGGSGAGQLVFLNVDGDLDDWADYDWDGYTQELYLGGPDLANGLFTDYELIYKRISDQIRADEDRLYLPFLNPMAQLDAAYQTTRFSGETNEAINGLPKPRVTGNVRHFQPALVDQTNLDFEAGDDTAMEVDAVFSNSFELEESQGTAGVWTTDGDATLSQTNGSQTDTSAQTITVDYDNLSSEKPAYFGFSLSMTVTGSATDTVFSVLLNLKDGGTEDQFFTFDFTLDGSDIEVSVGEDGPKVFYEGLTASGGNDSLSTSPFFVLFDWYDESIHLYFGNERISSAPMGAYPSGTKTWSIEANLTATKGSSTAAQLDLTADFDSPWAFQPANYRSVRAWGLYGAVSYPSNNTIRLVNNPQGSKITAHVAQQSAQGFETWAINSATTMTISGADSRTITADDSTRRGAILPMPRSYGDLTVQFLINTFDNAASPAVGLTAWLDGDTIDERTGTAAQMNPRAALLYDGGHLFLNNVNNSGVTAIVASSDVITFKLDRDNDAMRLWHGTTEATGSPFAITDFARARSKSGFSASKYYTADTTGIGTDGKEASGAVRLEVTGTPASNEHIVNWGARGVLIYLDTSRQLHVYARNSSGTVIADYRTSALSTNTTYMIMWAMDLAATTVQIYVDGVSDATAVTSATNDNIDWTTTDDCGFGVNHTANGNYAASCNIQYVAVALNYVDISDSTVRARIARSDNYPLMHLMAFGATPLIHVTNGDATANAGTLGAFTETGTVTTDDVPGDVYMPITPMVVLDTTNDSVTVRANSEDFSNAATFGGTAWGEVSSLYECLADVAGSVVDKENVFLDLATSDFCPSHGYGEQSNGRHRQKDEVCYWLARSNSAGLWIDRENQLQILPIVDPSTGTSVATITRDDDVGMASISREPDRGQYLSAVIGSWRVWAPHRDSEIAAAVDLEYASVVARQNGILSVITTTSLDSSYDHADEAQPFETTLQDGDPTDTGVTRSGETLGNNMVTLYSSKRRYYRIPQAFPRASDGDWIEIEPGDVVTLVTDRWSLSAGKKLLVIDAKAMDLDGSYDLVAWG